MTSSSADERSVRRHGARRGSRPTVAGPTAREERSWRGRDPEIRRAASPWVTSAALLMLAALTDSAAAVIVVNSTVHRGIPNPVTTCNTGFLNAAGAPECTFVGALQVANLTPATRDDIVFDIPAADPGYDAANGWWTIGQLNVQMSIGTPVTIDGYTQPGALPNTLAVGSDAVLRIQVLFTLHVFGDDTEIRGLALVRLRLMGAQRAIVSGNYIGTNPSGTAAQVPGTLETGLLVTSSNTSSSGASDCLIGGPDPEDRNVISGMRFGIYEQIYLPNPPSRNVYENNYIGLNAAGDAAIPNTLLGIYVDGFDETIRGNVISGNTAGVTVDGAARNVIIEDNIVGVSADGTKPLGNNNIGVSLNPYPQHGVHRVRRNRIENNYIGVRVAAGVTFVGTEILSNGIYFNPQGGIAFPNRMAVPVITGASADGIRDTIVHGTLTSTPSTPFTIELFASERCDALSGRGGQRFLGSGSYMTDPNGFVSFAVFGAPLPSTHGILTMTATDEVTHTTSEFSGCVHAGIHPLFDVVKTHAPEPVAEGGLLTYTIVAANRFDQVQQGITFEDILPAGVTFLSATASQGSCMESGGTVTCSLIDVPPYGTVEVEIQVQPDSVGTLVNTARVANSTSAEDIAHVVLVPPNATADFTVSLEGRPADLNPGALFDYILTARNLGPDPAAAKVEFHLPAGIVADPDPNADPTATIGSYDPNTGIWTTEILIPDPNGLLSETITIPVKVDAQATGCIDAVASVHPLDPTTTDPDSPNDAAARVSTGGCFDLQSQVRVYDQCFFFGKVIFEGFVRNTGPGTATGVVATWHFIHGNDCPSSIPACNVAERRCTAVAPCTIPPGQSVLVVREGGTTHTDIECSDDPFERELVVAASVPDLQPLNDSASFRFEESALTCFVATAAWGSPLEPHVQVLRDFRDRHLLTNVPGRAFVKAYYSLSPPIAAVIAERPILRVMVRGALTPLVLAVEFPVAAACIGLLSVGTPLAVFVGFRRHHRGRRQTPSRVWSFMRGGDAGGRPGAADRMVRPSSRAVVASRHLRPPYLLTLWIVAMSSALLASEITATPGEEATSSRSAAGAVRAQAAGGERTREVRAERPSGAAAHETRIAGAAVRALHPADVSRSAGPELPSGSAGMFLTDLAVASDLVVLGEISKARPTATGGAVLTVHVEEPLVGGPSADDLLVGVNSSRLQPGDRAILFLVQPLRVAGSAPEGFGHRRFKAFTNRFILTDPGRYILLAPELTSSAEQALVGRIRLVCCQQAGGPAASQSRDSAPARLAGPPASIQENGQAPIRRGRILFSHVRRALRGDPDLKQDAMQAREDLLEALDQSQGSFLVDTATVDRLRDLAERLAMEGTPEMQEALSESMESIESLEGQTLDAGQVDSIRELLLFLPGAVFPGRP